MKHVVTSQQVCHLWANKAQDSARNSSKSLFFEGPTIYSYGSHFPMARHVTNKRGESLILFTSRSYSVTTAKHLGYVRRAIPAGKTVIFTDDVLAEPSVKLLNEIQGQIEAAKNKGIRSRVRVHGLEDQVMLRANAFTATARFIGSRRNAKVPPQAWFDMLAFKRRRAALLDETRERRRAERQGKQKGYDHEDFQAWLCGAPVRFPASYRRHNGSCFMRIEGEEVVTNEGARVPLNDVRAIYPLLLDAVEHGETLFYKQGGNPTVGAFQLNEIREDGTVVVGCHPFCKEEILRFGRVLESAQQL